MINILKVNEWVESWDKKLDQMHEDGDYTEDMKLVVDDMANKINSGEFDCEGVKSEWKPERGDRYYTPSYTFGEWEVHVGMITTLTMFHETMIAKSEAFQTESDCKKYMNAKGWINDNNRRLNDGTV